MTALSNSLQRCKTCLLPETHETITYNSDGICSVCQNQGIKKSINWSSRLDDLDALIAQYRGKSNYDCIIPFSGGKDSTWTLYYLLNRYPGLRPLVVRFNHGFLRNTLQENCRKVFRKLGVAVHEFTPNWKVVTHLMLQSFLEKGDFCWHCHTGIMSYPMQVAIQESTPLIFWGEPSTEYTSYYSYSNDEQVDEERFNRIATLGISADDMLVRLDGLVDSRDLEPYRYPAIDNLRAIGYRSVCLGSYVPWDVKSQVAVIQQELGWVGDVVENVPPQYNYEKIECWMQGVRDFIKYIKRGYTRPSHLAAIDLRNNRISREDAQAMINEFESRRPPSLDLFLDYVGITEEMFYQVAMSHTVSPWRFDKSKLKDGTPTPDFESWISGNGLSAELSARQCSSFTNGCSGCS